MTISSVNSSSSAMMMRGMQRPDPSKMAADLFSKLDTTGKGYIEKSDLQTALGKLPQSDSSNSSSSSTSADDLFSKMDSDGNGKVTKEEMSATIEKIASQLDGPFPRMRMQNGQGGREGDMPPPPPPSGGQGTQKASSTDSSNSNQSSDPADTNGDGTVSAKEALAYAESQSSSSTNTSTSSADAQLMQMLAGGMPPPPPPQDGSQSAQGFTKDQLTSMSKDLSSTDSNKSKVMSDIASNFDAADANGDGKVSGSEARAFEESKNSSGTSSSTETSSSTSSASNADAQFMKQMMQLLKSYGFDQTAENSSFSTSA